MKKHCLIQKKLRLVACASLLAISPLYAVGAPKPMSDSDMGDVSAESGDVLNVMGVSASGENRLEVSESSSTTYDNTADVESGQSTESTADQRLKSTNNNIAYIETEQPINSQVDHTLTPSYDNAKSAISTFKISERSNGELGSATILYDEKDSVINVINSGSRLSINQSVRIQEVQLHQMRSSPTAPARGDYSVQGIYVNASVSIIPR